MDTTVLMPDVMTEKHLERARRMKSARQHFDQRLEGMVEARQSWVLRCQEIAAHTFPEYDRFLRADSRSDRGDIDYSKIYDTSPAMAASTFGEGMTSAITNQARRWFLQRHPLPMLADRPDIEAWNDECTSLILEAMTRGNFYLSRVRSYTEYGDFGNAAALGDEDKETILNWINLAPGEYWFAVNKRLQVDTCYREFWLTPAQMVQQFGLARVSESVKNAYEHNNRKERFRVIHAIEPVALDPMPGVDDQLGPGMRFRSVYYEYGSKSQRAGDEMGFLDVSGYHEFPVATERMFVVSTNAYGFGLGHRALADMKQLMYWARKIDRASDQEVDPALNIPTGKGRELFSAAPGARNPVAEGQNNQVTRTFDSAFNPQYAEQRWAILKDRIERMFYMDVFTLFSNMQTGADLRVLQAEQMKDEKLLRMSGVLMPVTVGLDVIINRYFGVMWRRGLLPEPPDDIRGDTLSVAYQNIIAQAQRAQSVANIERTAAFTGQLIQVTGDPSPADKLNTDKMIEEYGESVGISPKLIATDEEAARKRQERAAQQQAMAAAQVAKDGAAAMQSMAQTPTEGENYLNAISGALA